MSPVLIATIAGLITALCWGMGDWLAAKSSRKLDAHAINFTVQCTGTAVMIGVMLVSAVKIPSAQHLLIILLSAGLITTAFLIFVKALSSGAVGIVTPLGNMYPLLTLILAMLFLGSLFSGWQIVAMIAIVTGATLLAYEKNHNDISLKVLHRGTLLACAAAALWGVGFFLVDIIVNDVSWQALNGFRFIFMAIIAGIMLILSSRSATTFRIRKSFTSMPTVGIGLLFVVGAMAFFYGAERAGSVVIPAVLSAGGPLVASLLSAVIDKEKIGIIKRVGAIVVVGGIIALNIL